MKKIEEYVRSIPDFPEPGIIFRDITSVLQDAEGLQLAINSMQEFLKDVDVDVIAGAESRGFIFGMPIAYNNHKPFVLIRKFRPVPFFAAAVLCLCALCAVPMVRHAEQTAAVQSGQPLKGKIIAIDAGHGGGDPGAIGVTGTAEKEINLILAKKMKILLEEKGAMVVMTRTDDSVYSCEFKSCLRARKAS